MNVSSRSDVDHAEPRVVALAHPSLDRLVATFSSQLRLAHALDAGPTGGASTSPSDEMAPGTLRLGLILDARLISIASVEPDGVASIVTLEYWRGSGVDRQLLAVAIDRSLAAGARVPVFRGDRLDASLVALALSCGAEVIGRTTVRRLAPV